MSCLSMLDAFGTATEIGSAELEKGKLENMCLCFGLWKCHKLVK